MNYDNNKKFGLLQFHPGYGKFYLNSPKDYSRKIINAQTDQNDKFGKVHIQFSTTTLPIVYTTTLHYAHH